MKKPALAKVIFSGLSAAFGCALTLWLIKGQTFLPTLDPAVAPSIKNIGLQMLSTTQHGYILPFEVVSILLLSAMIGCIVIAIKVKK